MNTMAKVWSSRQEAIFRELSEGRGHLVVMARAGSGKSTTIIEGLRHIPEGKTVLMVAFNKAIAAELSKRVAEQRLSDVEVKTLHGHGFAAVRRAFREAKLDDDKSFKLAEKLFGPKEQALFSYAALSQLVRVAKDMLIDAENLEALDALVDNFGINAPETEAGRREFVEKSARVLARSKEVTDVIDFADMCWLPVVLDLRIWAYDVVLVDETQDLSPCQKALVLMCIKRGGRIVAVGDDRQAIYAFRGADPNSMPDLIEKLKAKVLPLSVTYRCARAIVALASQEVRDLEPAPGAPEGSVGGSTRPEMIRLACDGDMVISRTNAPLIGICLELLKKRQPAAIKGRDVGDALVALIDKSKADDIAALEKWIATWHARESERLAKKGRDVQEADDKRDCILALAEDATSIGDVKARAIALFTGKDDTNRVTLGTTHKLKGLEARRVWMLGDTYRRWKGGEEANLWYVAVTRAKLDLRIVTKERADAMTHVGGGLGEHLDAVQQKHHPGSLPVGRSYGLLYEDLGPKEHIDEEP